MRTAEVSDAPRRTGLRRPVIAALTLFAALFAITTVFLLRATGGHFTYALDDPYIHMAIAKNFALHGVWGVNADSFSSASSSPMWTGLLGAIFVVAGVHDGIPLVLNIAFAVLCIVALGLILEREDLDDFETFIVIGSVILFAPLVPLVWVGMEHTLQVLLTLATAWVCSDLVRQPSARRVALLCLLVALLVATRYEGLFVVAGCIVVLVLFNRRAAAVVLTGAGALPVVCVGLWNVSHGWFFLPASIMMKQTVLPRSQGTSLLASLLSSVAHAYPPTAFIGVLAAAVLLAGHDAYVSRSLRKQPLLTIFITAGLLHLLLARFGFLFRYEAYLMALGAMAIGIAVFRESPFAGLRLGGLARADLVTVAMVIAVMAAHERTISSYGVLINTGGHIYRQQRQMAAFIGRYYDSESVALNDIGAVSYYTNARIYDLAGLGSLEAATARRRGPFAADAINAWLDREHVAVAVVYDFWYQGGQEFYKDWQRVGTWVTDDQDEPGEGSVTFYARDVDAARRLRTNLQDFTAVLPARVAASIDMAAP
jgi:hypothetical protein